jgi:SAM-dependent methyltransferase
MMPTPANTGMEDAMARIRATWEAGNYDNVAQSTRPAAEEFIARRGIARGTRVLDAACGSGNLTIPAARAGAAVTGLDIAPILLDRARQWAAAEGLAIRLDEGDVENLPYEDGTFDLVVSMFGAMFAPRPERAARELLRVCRPGGQIALANWTPGGFVGEIFKVTGSHVPPPPGLPSPLLWGDEGVIRERLRDGTAAVAINLLTARLSFPLSVAETVEFYRVNYGPTLRAFAGLPEAGQAALRRDLEELYGRRNRATDGTTAIDAEYAEIVAAKR